MPGPADQSERRKQGERATPVGRNPDRKGRAALTTSKKTAEPSPKEGEGGLKRNPGPPPVTRNQGKSQAWRDKEKGKERGTQHKHMQESHRNGKRV